MAIQLFITQDILDYSQNFGCDFYHISWLKLLFISETVKPSPHANTKSIAKVYRVKTAAFEEARNEKVKWKVK